MARDAARRLEDEAARQLLTYEDNLKQLRVDMEVTRRQVDDHAGQHRAHHAFSADALLAPLHCFACMVVLVRFRLLLFLSQLCTWAFSDKCFECRQYIVSV